MTEFHNLAAGLVASRNERLVTEALRAAFASQVARELGQSNGSWHVRPTLVEDGPLRPTSIIERHCTRLVFPRVRVVMRWRWW